MCVQYSYCLVICFQCIIFIIYWLALLRFALLIDCKTFNLFVNWGEQYAFIKQVSLHSEFSPHFSSFILIHFVQWILNIVTNWDYENNIITAHTSVFLCTFTLNQAKNFTRQTHHPSHIISIWFAFILIWSWWFIGELQMMIFSWR